jgi:hypothetical protein
VDKVEDLVMEMKKMFLYLKKFKEFKEVNLYIFLLVKVILLVLLIDYVYILGDAVIMEG